MSDLKKGDIVYIKKGMIKDEIHYIQEVNINPGSHRAKEDLNHYFLKDNKSIRGSFHRHEILTLAEYREDRIDNLLDD